MEVAGLVLGTVGLAGLAGLLGSCIQLADQILAAVDLPRGKFLLERKCSAERHLLRRWGRMVGIHNGQVVPEHRKELDKQDVRDEVLAILAAIEMLLRDHRGLSQRYGLRVFEAPTASTYFAPIQSEKPRDTQSNPRSWRRLWKKRLYWAVHDKARFEALVDDLSFFVQKLFLIIPPSDALVENLLKTYASSSEMGFLPDNDAMGSSAREEIPNETEKLVEFVRISLGKLELTEPAPDGFEQEDSGPKFQSQDQDAQDSYHSARLGAERMRRALKNEKAERKLVEQLEGIERVHILQWLNATFTDKEYDTAFRSRCEGTCEWIVHRLEFEAWIGSIPDRLPESTDKNVSGLWIFGHAGSGKTFMSARLVEYFNVSCALPFAYFFCTFDSEANHPDAILRSWIAQIAMSRKAALKIVQEFRKGRETRPPTLSLLWTIFRKIIKVVEQCRFLVDGFDECSRSDPTSADYVEDLRSDFLDALLESTKGTSARFLLVSRDVSYVRSVFTDWQDHVLALELRPKDTLSDLRRYAEFAVESQLRGREHMLKARISDKLAAKADGMFLWVRLETPRLKPRMSAAQLDVVLDSMPTGARTLQKAYGRCLQDIIAQQESSDVRRALDVLRWTLYSRVPLDIAELMDILDFSETGNSFSLSDADDLAIKGFKDEVLRVCQPLLRFESVLEHGEHIMPHEGASCFRLTHFSVKEYLVSPGVFGLGDGGWLPFNNQIENQRYCAELCASYLSSKAFSKRDTGLFRKLKLYSHKFMEYASCYGIHHAQVADNSHAVFEQLFIDQNLARNFAFWTRFWSTSQNDADVELRIRAEDTENRSQHFGWRPPVPPLWFAALLGLVGMIEKLIESGHDPNESAQAYIVSRNLVFDRGTCLFAAIVGGHSAAVECILRYSQKRDVDLPCCAYAGSATKGSDDPTASSSYQRVPCGIFTNPLGIAIHFHNLEVIRVLLDYGVDVNHPIENLMSPLRQAFGYESIVKMLLQAGADVNALNGPYGTVLQAAAEAGSESIVRLLLESGAEVNAISGFYGTAFQATKSLSIMNVLGMAGASFSLTSHTRRLTYDPTSRFDEQSSSGIPSAASLAMITPIDTQTLSLRNAQSSLHRTAPDGCTVLHYSCKLLRHAPSLFSQIQQYIDTGAEVNSPSSGGIPLEFLIAQRDHPDYIAYLLERGADPRLLSRECISSLTSKPFSRFIYSPLSANDGRWIEFPPSPANTPRWNAEELAKVKDLLQAYGVNHPEVYFDSENWATPHNVAGFTRSLILHRQAKRHDLIAGV